MSYQENPERQMDVSRVTLARFEATGGLLESPQDVIYFRLGKLLSGKRVIDAGCGIGVGTAMMSACGVHAIGLDSIAKNVEMARSLYPWIHFWCADIREVCLDSDAIVCVEVIEHMKNPELAIERIKRAAREVLYLSTPNRLNATIGESKPHNDYHVREYRPDEMLAWLDGWSVTIRDPVSWQALESTSTITPLVYEARRA